MGGFRAVARGATCGSRSPARGGGSCSRARGRPVRGPRLARGSRSCTSTGSRTAPAPTSPCAAGSRRRVVLGSRATDVLAGLGPARLRAGDELARRATTPATRSRSPSVAPWGAPHDDELEVELAPGPRADWFAASAHAGAVRGRLDRHRTTPTASACAWTAPPSTARARGRAAERGHGARRAPGAAERAPDDPARRRARSRAATRSSRWRRMPRSTCSRRPGPAPASGSATRARPEPRPASAPREAASPLRERPGRRVPLRRGSASATASATVSSRPRLARGDGLGVGLAHGVQRERVAP